LFAKHEYERAERLCRRAYKADGTNAEAIALLAWLEAMKPSNQRAEATRIRIAMLDRALSIDPTHEQALFWRAQLHKRVENHAAAMRDFRHVVAMNDRNLDAVRELRLYEMRVRKNSIQMKAVSR